MKCLLDNQYAPTTFNIGFVEAPFEAVLQWFVAWHKSLAASFKIGLSTIDVAGALPDLLAQLFPVAAPSDREMVVETRSTWTAYFDNSLISGDATSRVGVLCEVFECRGVAVACVPHRQPVGGRGVYGAVTFDMFAPHRTHFLNYLRSVRLVNNDRWEFHTDGPQQPFEEVETYQSPRLVDRFTPAMAERYCAALGIDIFNDAFYGPRAEWHFLSL